MTESQYNSQVTEYLKNAGCIVFKHSDHFTTGVPDLSCTTRGHTTWFEVKVLGPEDLFTERVFTKKDNLQFFTMSSLEIMGRAYYLIYWNSKLWIFPPSMFGKLKGIPHKIAQEQILKLVQEGRFTEPPCWTPSTDFAFVLKLARGE